MHRQTSGLGGRHGHRVVGQRQRTRRDAAADGGVEFHRDGAGDTQQVDRAHAAGQIAAQHQRAARSAVQRQFAIADLRQVQIDRLAADQRWQRHIFVAGAAGLQHAAALHAVAQRQFRRPGKVQAGGDRGQVDMRGRTEVAHAVREIDRASAGHGKAARLIEADVQRARGAEVEMAQPVAVVDFDRDIAADPGDVERIGVGVAVKIAVRDEHRGMPADRAARVDRQTCRARNLVGQDGQGLPDRKVGIEHDPMAAGGIVDPVLIDPAHEVVPITIVIGHIDVAATQLRQVDIGGYTVQIDAGRIKPADDLNRCSAVIVQLGQISRISLIGAQFHRYAIGNGVGKLVEIVAVIFAIIGRLEIVGRTEIDRESRAPCGQIDVLGDRSIDHQIAGADQPAGAAGAIGRNRIDQAVGPGPAVKLAEGCFQRLAGEGRQQHLVAGAVFEIAVGIVERDRISAQRRAVRVGIGQRDIDPIVDRTQRQRCRIRGLRQVHRAGHAGDADAAAAVTAIHHHAAGHTARHHQLRAPIEQQVIDAERARIVNHTVALREFERNHAGVDLREVGADRTVLHQLLDVFDQHLAVAEFQMQVARFTAAERQQLIGIGAGRQRHVQIVKPGQRRIGHGIGRSALAVVGQVFQIDAGGDLRQIGFGAARGQVAIDIDGVGAVAGDVLVADLGGVDIQVRTAAQIEHAVGAAFGGTRYQRTFGHAAAVGRNQHVLHAILEAELHRLIDVQRIQAAVRADIAHDIDGAGRAVVGVGHRATVGLRGVQDQARACTQHEIVTRAVRARSRARERVPIVVVAVLTQLGQVDHVAVGHQIADVDPVLPVRGHAIDLRDIEPRTRVGVRIDGVVDEIDRDRNRGQIVEIPPVEIAVDQHRAGAVGRSDQLVGRFKRGHFEHSIGAEHEIRHRGIGHRIGCGCQVGGVAAGGRTRTGDIDLQRLRAIAAIGREPARTLAVDRDGHRIGRGFRCIQAGGAAAAVVDVEIDRLPRGHRRGERARCDPALVKVYAPARVGAINPKVVLAVIGIVQNLRAGAKARGPPWVIAVFAIVVRLHRDVEGHDAIAGGGVDILRVGAVGVGAGDRERSVGIGGDRPVVVGVDQARGPGGCTQRQRGCHARQIDAGRQRGAGNAGVGFEQNRRIGPGGGDTIGLGRRHGDRDRAGLGPADIHHALAARIVLRGIARIIERQRQLGVGRQIAQIDAAGQIAFDIDRAGARNRQLVAADQFALAEEYGLVVLQDQRAIGAGAVDIPVRIRQHALAVDGQVQIAEVDIGGDVRNVDRTGACRQRLKTIGHGAAAMDHDRAIIGRHVRRAGQRLAGDLVAIGDQAGACRQCCGAQTGFGAIAEIDRNARAHTAQIDRFGDVGLDIDRSTRAPQRDAVGAGDFGRGHAERASGRHRSGQCDRIGRGGGLVADDRRSGRKADVAARIGALTRHIGQVDIALDVRQVFAPGGHGDDRPGYQLCHRWRQRRDIGRRVVHAGQGRHTGVGDTAGDIQRLLRGDRVGHGDIGRIAEEGLAAAGAGQRGFDILDRVRDRIDERLGKAEQFHRLCRGDGACCHDLAGHMAQQRVGEIVQDVGNGIDHREIEHGVGVICSHRRDARAGGGIGRTDNAVDRVGDVERTRHEIGQIGVIAEIVVAILDIGVAVPAGFKAVGPAAVPAAPALQRSNIRGAVIDRPQDLFAGLLFKLCQRDRLRHGRAIGHGDITVDL